MGKSILAEKSIEFSIQSVFYYRWLTKEKKEFVMSKQFLRSATSIGANIHEANFGISRPDFIAKMQIALKEASETEYWLTILRRTDLLPNDFSHLEHRCAELKAMLTSAIPKLFTLHF